MSEKYKKFSTTLTHYTLVSAVTRCITISTFSSLLGIPIGNTSSEIELKTCAITLGIKKYKSVIKKKKKKHYKIVMLAKFKLNTMELLISKDLFHSNISHKEFVLINNVLKEYDDLKEEIEYLKT